MGGMIAPFLVAIAVTAQTASLTFTKPPAWTDRAAGSSMRVAEFVVPRAPGDTEDAELIVYYFGGGGGSVEANLARWTSQFESTKEPARTTATVNGLKLTSLDVSGTYVAEMTPGATERHNKPNFRLRAGVVETANGPYFIKLTGPAKTIAKWDRAFEQFVASLKLT